MVHQKFRQLEYSGQKQSEFLLHQTGQRSLLLLLFLKSFLLQVVCCCQTVDHGQTFAWVTTADEQEIDVLLKAYIARSLIFAVPCMCQPRQMILKREPVTILSLYPVPGEEVRNVGTILENIRQ